MHLSYIFIASSNCNKLLKETPWKYYDFQPLLKYTWGWNGLIRIASSNILRAS